MKTIQPFLIFSMLFFLVSSCVKREDSVVNFDILVINKSTGERVKASVTLQYQTRESSGSYRTLYLGDTGSDGTFTVNTDTGIMLMDPHLLINGKDGQYSDFFLYTYVPDCSLSIMTGKEKQHYFAALKPTNFAILHLKNVNCFDATDSVWVNCKPHLSGEETEVATGCADTTYETHSTSFIYNSNPEAWTFWTTNPTITFDIKVKRNGVISQFQQSFDFLPHQVTELLIEY